MDRSYYTLFPNFYIILVSPSGVGMKGTALSQGIELLDLSEINLNILRGKITPTRLISRLNSASLLSTSGDAEMLIFSREFKVFTKGVIKDSSLIEDLTDLYDNNTFDYETENSLRNQIKRPCIQILGASTPEWLSGGSAGDLMSGGFGARMIPVAILKDEKQIAWPMKTPTEAELQKKLIADLQKISDLRGVYYVTEGAKEYFEGWYMNRLELRKAAHRDSRLDGYYSKKHDQMLKLSMVLAASKSGEMVIDIEHIRTAQALLEENERNILFAYSGAATDNEMKYKDQVLEVIKDKGEVTHVELAQRFFHGVGRRGLREVIYGLIEEKRIEMASEDTKTKPRVIYRYIEGGDEY